MPNQRQTHQGIVTNKWKTSTERKTKKKKKFDEHELASRKFKNKKKVQTKNYKLVKIQKKKGGREINQTL